MQYGIFIFKRLALGGMATRICARMGVYEDIHLLRRRKILQWEQIPAGFIQPSAPWQTAVSTASDECVTFVKVQNQQDADFVPYHNAVFFALKLLCYGKFVFTADPRSFLTRGRF
jgi:hypothetical protein